MELLINFVFLGLSIQSSLQQEDPPLTDLNFFPCYDFVVEQRESNCKYRKFVEEKLTIWEKHNANYWRKVFYETKYCYRCWDALYDAQGGFCEEEDYRRQALRRLRQLIGEEAYYKGLIPPPVPIWRFVVIDN